MSVRFSKGDQVVYTGEFDQLKPDYQSLLETNIATCIHNVSSFMVTMDVRYPDGQVVQVLTDHVALYKEPRPNKFRNIGQFK